MDHVICVFHSRYGHVPVIPPPPPRYVDDAVCPYLVPETLHRHGQSVVLYGIAAFLPHHLNHPFATYDAATVLAQYAEHYLLSKEKTAVDFFVNFFEKATAVLPP